ncbi:MFS transporter [Litoreibacter albidus]|uniref:MFS transporter n=1 Tax=Litoreibacter albidus TaxID=670155 RepID=UPI0037364035
MVHASRHKWRALTLTGLAVVLSMTTWFSATAVLSELSRLWSLTPAESAWLTNGVQAGFVLGALASSVMSLADIWPMTRLMTASAVLAAVANAMLLLEPGVMGAIIARFVTGVALAGIYPPALKFIATWFVRGRGLAMGALVGALTLGSALPHLVRAFGATFPWQAVIAVSSAAAISAAIVFATTLREGPHAFARAHVDIRQIGAILRNRPVMLANLGYFGHMWELYAMWGWFLAYATAANASGMWPLDVSLLAFAVVAVGAPGCILAGALADRIGRCATTALAMAISGTCALLIGFMFDAPTWLFLTVALMWGLTIVADSAQFSAAVTELSEPTQVGAGLAFQMGVGFAITIFTIWLLPLVADALGGWRWSFLVLVPGPVIGLAAMLILRNQPEAARLAGGKR